MSTIKVDTVQSTGGGAVTLTNQHAPKVWLHYDQKGDSGSTQALDSFNVSSITDANTGQYEVNVTNNFSNALHRRSVSWYCFMGFPDVSKLCWSQIVSLRKA